jgi:hypothetical protein
MQEKPVEQVRLFIRDKITGRHMFNSEALLALGINLAEAQSRGFQINLTASALGSRSPAAISSVSPMAASKIHLSTFLAR